MAGQMKILMLVCMLGASVIFSSNSQATGCPDPSAYPSSNGCSLPGLRVGGFPYFEQGVDLHYKANKHGFKVKAKYDKDSFMSSFLVNPEDVLDITKTNFKFKARVRDGAAYGSIKIRGVIDDLGISRRSTLITADLSGPWVIGEDGTLLGFNTENIVCHSAINAYIGGGGCTKNEVIYLALQDAITDGAMKLKTTGLALTTVPVPAAAWLFGSGLLGLAGIARRRKTA